MSVLSDTTTGATTGMALGGPIGAGIGAGAGLLLGGAEYLWNKNKAKKDEKNRPQYDIPKEVGQGLALANQQALQGLPEAQKQQYLTDMQRGLAYSLGQNQTRKGGLSNIAALNENQNQGYANLMAQDAGARMANQKQLYGQLQNVADYKGQQFQLSQLNPYYENMTRDQANRGALMQNISKGAQLGMYAQGLNSKPAVEKHAPMQTFAPIQGSLNTNTRPNLPQIEMNYDMSLNNVSPDERNTFSNRTGASNLGW